ncbi:MAG: hypothetical protein IJQ50_07775 [Clostridia bacterium]|nr:hypothetical protein [Clostridia bacterium]
MKKRFYLIICLVMMILLTSCGEKQSKNTNYNNSALRTVVSDETINIKDLRNGINEENDNVESSEENDEEESEEEYAEERTEGIVYATRTGEKYHRDGCRYLRKSRIPMSLSNVRKLGLTPCSKCNSPR